MNKVEYLDWLRRRSPWPEGTRALVVGLGSSGRAAVQLLTALNLRVVLLESNELAVSKEFHAFAEEHGVLLHLGPHKAEYFIGADLVVSSPGIPLRLLDPYLDPENPPCLIGELELALPFVREPILAVSGTSGKTTCASLAAAMLEKAGKRVFLGGNIGTPLSSCVLQGRALDVIVLEVSSFQLQGSSSFHPHVAVLLNLTENHLDHHERMEEYVAAKLQLFRRQTETDFAVLSEKLLPLYRQVGGKAQVKVFEGEAAFQHMPLLGQHNQWNAAAAFLACQCFGVNREQAAEAVALFKPLRHRLEFVCERKGVRFVNDSKCTTVEALAVALASFDRPLILLAGGKFKGGDLHALRSLVRERVRQVVLYGGSREFFESSWENTVPMTWLPDLGKAVHYAKALGREGDVVLLSPATSSYDQFANYIQRGDEFCRLARSEL